MGGGGRRGLGERGGHPERVSPYLAAPSFLRGVAKGAGILVYARKSRSTKEIGGQKQALCCDPYFFLRMV